MPAFYTFGRVLFAVLFIYSGATKLFGIQATTEFIAAKVIVPSLLVPYTSQLETMTGMSTPQMLAIAVGAGLFVFVWRSAERSAASALLSFDPAAAAAAPETVTSCQTPPEALSPLPLACPAEVSPV